MYLLSLPATAAGVKRWPDGLLDSQTDLSFTFFPILMFLEFWKTG